MHTVVYPDYRHNLCTCLYFSSFQQYEMSANGNASNFGNHSETSAPVNRSHNQHPDAGRAVTDAVHERFRTTFVYCEDCKEKFIGNGVSIHKHFNKSHPADIKCIYCMGKVFHYFKVKNDNNKAEKVYYHWCRDWMAK